MYVDTSLSSCKSFEWKGNIQRRSITSLHQVVGYEPGPLAEPDTGLAMLELGHGPPVTELEMPPPMLELGLPPPMLELETPPPMLEETPPPGELALDAG